MIAKLSKKELIMLKKMIILVIILSCLLIPLLAKETGTLKGTVTDENGDLIPYANIVIQGTTFSTTCSDKGEYEIKGITPGTYTIVCQMACYETKEITEVKILAKKIYTLHFKLNKNYSQVNDRSLKAKEELVKKDKASASKSSYADQMKDVSVSSVDDVIAQSAGVTQKDGQLFVRGGRANEVKFTIDGMSVSDSNNNTQSTNARYSMNMDFAPLPKEKKTIINNTYNSHYYYGESHCPPYYQKRYYYPPRYNTEEYKAINPYPFKYAIAEPLSTFSIDVDTATYSNVRRMLNQGYLPQSSYVRIEEMINYFSYSYPEPKDNEPISISYEMGVCPWNIDHDIVKVGLKGKTVSYEDAPEANLVFLIDVSGSMSDPNKLPLVKQSLKMLVNQMRAKDQIGIVTYASQASIKLESTPVSKRQVILDAIDELYSGGSTAGGDGIKMAYDIASEHFDKKKNNRIMLCTDGDFNVGAQSNEDMEALITKKRESGVFLSVLGFGMGNYKDSKMEILADKGNGNYYYIDDLIEAKRVLVTEMSGTLNTIAKDVKIQIEFNPAKVRAYRLIGYENRELKNEDFKNDKIDAGEMGAGQTVTVLYEIVRNNSNEKDPNAEELKYQEIKYSEEALKSNDIATMKFRYKDPDGTVSKEMSQIFYEYNTYLYSKELNFACSVAGFGMMLQKSKFKETLTWDKIKKLAKQSIGKDPEGYRREFISLIEKAELLDKQYGTPSE